MTDLFSTWLDIALAEAEARTQAVIDQSTAAAHAYMRLAFEHDRRSLAQRLRRDLIHRPTERKS